MPPVILSEYVNTADGWRADAEQAALEARSIDELSGVLSLCRQGLASDPSVETVDALRRLAAWAHNRRGEMLIDQQRREDALAEFDEAIRFDEDSSLAIHNRAVTLAEQGRTADALAFYAIGLAGYAAIKILAPAFYALGDARKPMLISLLSILINFILNWLLVEAMRERGLALSTSIVALLNFILLYLLIRRRIKGIEGRATLMATAKIIAASIVMGGACWAVTRAAGAWLAHTLAAEAGGSIQLSDPADPALMIGVTLPIQ